MTSGAVGFEVRTTSWVVAGLLGLGIVQGDGGAQAQPSNPLNIDVRRSLAVTDLDVLERFPLQRVMDQLAALSGVPGLTGITLFQRWWDTQNRSENGLFTDVPHCDEQTIATVPSLNGYPYDCRELPHEGRLAACTSFSAPDCAFRPIGLFNRFDLAPQDGSHCGEYRIVYAKETGVTDPLDRALLIFEATMPNPTPAVGLQGCRPLVERWAHFSQLNAQNARANLLEHMYFEGMGQGFPAVVRPAHYGDNAQGLGQIRTNQFAGFQAVNPKVWTLREFKLKTDCSGPGGACRLQTLPVADGVNAFGPLFAPGSMLPQKAAFDAFFPSQVSSLAASSIAGISMMLPSTFDSGQSHSSGPSNEMNYPLHFGAGASTLRSGIDAQLATLSGSLSADDIVARAQAMSCAGCHKLSDNKNLGGGLVWPASLSFVHVTERQTELVNGKERYLISPALTDAFLPHRKLVMEAFLTGAPLPIVPPGLPIGGHPVH